MNTTHLLDPAFLAQLDRLALVSRRLWVGRMQAERRSPHRGGSVEFADFRTYTHGDDLRQIDWNAYARLDRLFLKLFVAEEDLTVHLLLDASRSMAFDEAKWLHARRLAAALGYIALVGMDRLTGAALGDGQTFRGGQVFRPHRGKRSGLAWLDWLSHLEAGGGVDPESALRDYASRARSPGPLLLIGDLMGPGWESGLRFLAAHRFEITVLHLLTPQELAPALEGDLRLVDSESQAGVEITADYGLLQRYQARLAAWREHWQETCARIGGHYVLIETDQPLESLILEYLQRHSVVS